jgi:hypothetical protein
MKVQLQHVYASLALTTVLLLSPAYAYPEKLGATVHANVEADWIRVDRAFNAASPSGHAEALVLPVSTAQDAAGACDGVQDGRFGFHVASSEQDPWWQVDLGESVQLDRVVIHNRTDGNTAPRTRQIRILVSEFHDDPHFKLVYQHDGRIFHGGDRALVVGLRDRPISARVLRLAISGRCSFALDEVEVYGANDPGKNIALGRPADQKSVSQHSSISAPVGPDLLVDASFSLAHSLQVVHRAEELATRLQQQDRSTNRLHGLSARVAALKGRLERLAFGKTSPEKTRQALYFKARALLRQIAWCNPLLDFDKILFIKRHDAKGVFHMCDQYYGFNGVRGGGLYVLANAFGEDPKLTDLMEGVLVSQGRLRGRSLQGGVFLSPELSYDGQTILFAWSEGRGKDLEWTPQSSYHIFKINSDGTNLVQLTDGPCNDFDPCFLPNGRIVFVSERRGGYLRCGRHCPVYTMYSMDQNGQDIICVSFHETHEWHPSVDNDGMIVYTRWDYVDRDTNIAHHIWSCFPDGRDPRSFHGNYPLRRETRPWMEMSIRAIPGSHKYVATAAAHHGHAFGSLVMIDQRVNDDRAASQLTRLTPDVPFPEAERHIRPIKDCMVYATPWPLSEDDYLCVYDVAAANHGIYWIDRFGNRELIYRDPKIASLSPIPLRARPRPPVIPTQTSQSQTLIAGTPESKETIAVMNVYDSDFDWPAGTRVAALRIVQALPKTTAPPNQPRIGIANQTNARAVLGTVPVEADGSAYFEAPVGKAIYFQALDEQGMAIQSMRSATYVHPGEKLTCVGCHEPKPRLARTPSIMPTAMQRGPSVIQAEVDGSNPFNYVRLVQSVLDRNCVDCHQEQEALDLCGVVEGQHGWTRSYTNLAETYGFYFHVSNGSINTGVHGGSRSIPGKFGARASSLLKYTGPEHHGVKLSKEDLHRLVLWLDCNSEFYGSYENTVAQARGEIVLPTLN